ncbi:cGMP-dependent protein kinase 1 [Bulinus truncatus]|nr:cGMP-dependent protein kinase 1 [Bulinus truncatus]
MSNVVSSPDGVLEVHKDDKRLGEIKSGGLFGELAILYNCTRTASVKAITNTTLWVLDRRVFQTIMMKTGLQKREENMAFLKSVPLLKQLPSDKLAKIADVLEYTLPEGRERALDLKRSGNKKEMAGD